ncbi:MAG: serine--tRNA ligase [Bdellovibrionales bacterium]|nr:serine--tRNA ligase [Bdellovibrionales bacterium]
MIDLHDFRQRPEAYQAACEKKRIKFDVQAFLQLDEKVRILQQNEESLRAEQNSANKQIKSLNGDEKQKLLDQMKSISTTLKEVSAEHKNLKEDWEKQKLFIPSIPLDKVPDGKDDSENVEIRRHGDIPNFNFTPKDHVELGKSLDLFDIERGVKIAGARNYFLKGDGARLQDAVMMLAKDLLYKRGYTLFDVPHIVKWDAMMGTSYFPGGEDQAYHLDERDPDFYLIGTSEVSVTSYRSDEIIPREELPLRYAGYSPCYRREAGTYGKDTHGLYRIHQFYKVEQVIVCEADESISAKMHTELLENAEEAVKLLELPYRVVDVCSGDMGQGQVYKNDIEVWMPSRESYGETHSCSSFHDFQARRLKMRYKDDSGKTVYCHTLNNTCVASPRILIPLLEVHQRSDGSVKIPKALQGYMGGQELLVPKIKV